MNNGIPSDILAAKEQRLRPTSVRIGNPSCVKQWPGMTSLMMSIRCSWAYLSLGFQPRMDANARESRIVIRVHSRPSASIRGSSSSRAAAGPLASATVPSPFLWFVCRPNSGPLESEAISLRFVGHRSSLVIYHRGRRCAARVH